MTKKGIDKERKNIEESSEDKILTEEYVDKFKIRAENVHKTYLLGTTAVAALRGVDLNVKDQDFVIIMGPSGSGKTYMFLDNARAHHAKLLQPFLEEVREQFELVFLPPYSPDLNEIEKLWQKIKSEVVYNGFYDTFTDFKNALIRALRRKNNS
ncbi:unnamed protein product, partial [marine sediment metagenome]